MDAGKNAMKLDISRILIAGTGSGSGKTTITAGLLYCLKELGYRTASFKCGPDYIDPMFHERVTGRPSGNLDPYFCDRDTLRWMMAEGSSGCDMIVAEGVMGYYDGVGFTSRYSTRDVAAASGTPVILIVNCKGLGASAGAVLKGFLEYSETEDPDHAEEAGQPADFSVSSDHPGDCQIRGVIFNHLPERLYPEAAEMARRLGVIPVGFLPPDARIALKSRHLGLVTADEVEDFDRKIRRLAETMKKTLDFRALTEIASSAPTVDVLKPVFIPEKPFALGTVIAVARDRAFCFLYKENLDLLERLGCRIQYFSPLSDQELPPGTQGIILSGGYPELYARELSANKSICNAIREAAEAGMPVLAECGGFMYLHRTLEDSDGTAFPEVGLIRGDCYRTERLRRFGYVSLTVKKSGLLGDEGTALRGHEFHYWDSTESGENLSAVKPDGSRSWNCGFHTDTMYAGFPHLHFYACPEACERFVKKCIQFGKRIQDS